MADTQTLLALIEEFPEPFLDPESALPPALKAEEAVIEEVEAPQSSSTTWRDSINSALSIIAGEKDLEGLSAIILANISSIAQLRQSASQNPTSQQQPLPSVWDDALTEFEVPNLPETYARQGSGDCPSGMCPIDH